MKTLLAKIVGAATATNHAAQFQQVPYLEKTITFQGPVSTLTGSVRLPIALGTYTFKKVQLQTSSAPTGAAVIVDVNKNGSTIFSTQANRPQIAASATQGNTTTFNTTTVTTGDYLTVDIDQKGSTLAGDDLVVVIVMERTA